MTKRTTAGLLFLTLTLAACGQKAVEDNLGVSPVDFGTATTKTEPVAVMPAAASISAQSLGELAAVFGDAQAVTPLQPWKIRSDDLSKQSVTSQGAPSFDGYTIPFYDFYGVSFGYATFVDRAGDTNPAALIAAGKANPNPNVATPQSWQVGTIVSGANTARDVISNYYPHLRALETLFGQVGFNRNQVQQFVMPLGGLLWAKMKDGRYYDLSARAYVSVTGVAAAKSDYDNMLSNRAKLKTNSAVSSQSISAQGQNWVRAQQLGALNTSNNAAVLGTNLSQQQVSSACGTRSFMWWSWSACDTIASSYSGNNLNDDGNGYWLDMSIDAHTDGQYYLDTQHLWTDKAYEGCGPESLAVLMKFARDKKGVSTMNSGAAGYQKGVDDLISATGAWASGDQRSLLNVALPFYSSGLVTGARAYLYQRGVINQVTLNGSWSVPSAQPNAWEDQLNIFKDKLTKKEPVIAMVGNSALKHFGIVSKFEKGSFTDLMIFMPSQPSQMWNQSAFWSNYTSGAYALYYQ